MRRTLSPGGLRAQNRAHRGAGGTSAESRGAGYVPGFLDTETGATYRSRDAAGRAAAVHLLDGLPEWLVVRRSAAGRVAEVKHSVVAGFLRDGRFFTREQVSSERAAPSSGSSSSSRHRPRH